MTKTWFELNNETIDNLSTSPNQRSILRLKFYSSINIYSHHKKQNQNPQNHQNQCGKPSKSKPLKIVSPNQSSRFRRLGNSPRLGEREREDREREAVQIEEMEEDEEGSCG